MTSQSKTLSSSIIDFSAQYPGPTKHLVTKKKGRKGKEGTNREGGEEPNQVQARKSKAQSGVSLLRERHKNKSCSEIWPLVTRSTLHTPQGFAIDFGIQVFLA
jgi:hypothetical protein